MNLMELNDSTSSLTSISVKGVEEFKDLKEPELSGEKDLQVKDTRKSSLSRSDNLEQLLENKQLLTKCQYKCASTISKEDRYHIYKCYRSLKSFASKCDFFNDFTKLSETPSHKSCFHRPGDFRKPYYVSFYIDTTQGREKVCHDCFCLLLGESSSRIVSFLDQKWEEMEEEFTEEIPERTIKLFEDDEEENEETEESEKLDEEKKIFEDISEGSDCLSDLNIKKDLEIENYTKEVAVCKSKHSKNDKFILSTEEESAKVAVCKIEKSKNEKFNLSAEEESEIENHIKKFALWDSRHFADYDTGKYLPVGLDVETMYSFYREEVPNPVSITFYQEVLEQSGLQLATSFLGKCIMCAKASEALKITSDFGEKSKCHRILKKHLAESMNSEKSLNRDLKRCKEKISVYSFGFQPSLPTPHLDEGRTYYKQPSWTYNFTVTKNSNNTFEFPGETKMYMWHESLGGRTVKQIASCLYEFLQDLPFKIRTVILHSPSCHQESRKKILSLLFSYILHHHKTLETIEHKFLFDGHHHNEKILEYNLEIMRENRSKIEQPQDWYKAFVKGAGKSSIESEVVVMTPKMFHDFEGLWTNIYVGDESFIDENIKCLRYVKSGVIFCKKNWKSIGYDVMDLGLKEGCNYRSLMIRKPINLVNLSGTKEKEKKKNEIPNPVRELRSFKNVDTLRNTDNLKKGVDTDDVEIIENGIDQVVQTSHPTEICFTKEEPHFRNEEELLKNPSIETATRMKTPNIKEKLDNEDPLFFSNNENIEIKISVPVSNSTRNFIEISSNDKAVDQNRSWSCPNQCHLKIPEEDQKKISENYWSETAEKRFDYLLEMINMQSKPRTEEHLQNQKGTESVVQFYLETAKGRENVCEYCFSRILGERNNVVSTALKSKSQAILEELEPSEQSTKRVMKPGISKCSSVERILSNISGVSWKNNNKLRENKLREGWKRLRSCRNGCSLRLKTEDQKNIFYSYWKNATIESRTSYIIQRIETTPTYYNGIARYIMCRKYYHDSSDGRQRVCKNCFCHVLGESISFLDTLLRTKKSGGTNHDAEELKHILQQVEFFLYSREKDEESLMEITIHDLYEDYSRQISGGVSIGHYQNLLAGTNYKHKLPFLSKCSLCRNLGELFSTAEPDKVSDANRSLCSHLEDCKVALENKFLAEESARQTKNKVVCTFSFQPSFPIPFQKESRSIFNLTIQQVSKNLLLSKPKSYIWTQTTKGKRSANEIASCLYEYLKSLPTNVESVIFYSHSCSGESRGEALAMMFSYFLGKQKPLKFIDHRFLEPGHLQGKEHLGEHWVRNIVRKDLLDEVSITHDWYEAIKRSAKSSNVSEFVFMTPDKFYDFGKLGKNISRPSYKVEKPYYNEEVRALRYINQGVISYKTSLREYAISKLCYLGGCPEFCRKLVDVELCNIDSDPELKEGEKGHLDFSAESCIKEEVDLSIDQVKQEEDFSIDRGQQKEDSPIDHMKQEVDFAIDFVKQEVEEVEEPPLKKLKESL